VPAVVDLDRDSRALERFLELPALLYAGDARWSAPSRASVLCSLQRPQFAARQRAFLAERGGAPAARVVARVSPALRDEHGRPRGLLGFFESVDDAALVQELLGAASSWLRTEGAGEILGPMDGDTWHRYRFNVGPHEAPPFLMEPYNKAWYAELWERAGFVPLESYHSLRVDDVAAAEAKLAPEHERALAAGYRFRPLEREHLERELALLHELSLRCFAGNFLYTDLPRAEFLALYEGVGPLLDAELVWFAYGPDGNGGAPVAFVFALPDLFAAVAAMRSRSDFLAKLRFLWKRGAADAVNVKTLGVVPEHRRARLAYALTARVYRRALELGLARANLCLIRDGNPSARLDAGRGALLRRYTLYRLGAEPEG